MSGRSLSAAIRLALLAAGVALAAAPAVVSQEVEHTETPAEHADHAEAMAFRHYVTFFGGLATHLDEGNTGGAMGVSYAYKLSHRWAIGLKLEYVTSSIERDVVVLVGGTFEPIERLEIAVAVGSEQSEKEVVEHGTTERERESEALLRLGVAYGFPIREGVYLAPEFNTDITESRVTLVYGLAFSVGL